MDTKLAILGTILFWVTAFPIIHLAIKGMAISTTNRISVAKMQYLVLTAFNGSQHSFRDCLLAVIALPSMLLGIEMLP